jgi:hypothetical protein
MLQDRFIRRRGFRRRRGYLFTRNAWPLVMVAGGLVAAVIFVLKGW